MLFKQYLWESVFEMEQFFMKMPGDLFVCIWDFVWSVCVAMMT